MQNNNTKIDLLDLYSWVERVVQINNFFSKWLNPNIITNSFQLPRQILIEVQLLKLKWIEKQTIFLAHSTNIYIPASSEMLHPVEKSLLITFLTRVNWLISRKVEDDVENGSFWYKSSPKMAEYHERN